MSALSRACDIAKEFEGCSLTPYRDPVGYWTIGWGHLISHDKSLPKPDMTWTQEEADAALEEEMRAHVSAVLRRVPPTATEGQIAALADFSYNLGIGALQSSTLLRKFKAGDIEGAAQEFKKWKFAGGQVLPGLVRRRAVEESVFMS